MKYLMLEIDGNLESLLRIYAEENEDLEDTAKRILECYIPSFQSSQYDEFLDEYKRSFKELKKAIFEQSTANSAAMLKLVEDRLKNGGFTKPGEFGFYFNEE